MPLQQSNTINPFTNKIQGGPKNGLFFRLDNFVTVSPRKACSMSKFRNFIEKKVKKLAFR